MVFNAARDESLERTFPADKRTMAFVSNIVAFFAVFIQICVVLYSSFIAAMMYTLGSSPTMTYRFLLHIGRIGSLLQCLIFIPNLLAFVMIGLRFHLSAPDGHVATGAVLWVAAAFFCVFHGFIGYDMAKAHPASFMQWAGLHGAILPYAYMSKEFQDDAQRLGDLLAGDAQANVLRSLDRDHDGEVDSVDALESDEGRALDAWVTSTLPKFDAARRGLLVRGLLGEDLGLEELRTAGRLPEGTRLLMELLHLDGQVQLSHGEKVRLVASLV